MKKINKIKKIQSILKNKKVVTLGLIVIAVILFWKFRSSSGTDLETASVSKGVVREELILSGELKADEHANLIFPSSGELDYIAVSEGSEVKKNDVLARLDTTSLYQALQSAEADLRKYETSLENVYDQVQGHENDESFATRDTRTTAETAKDKAYRAYVIAQKNLSNATLRAPFDGVVTKLAHPYTDFNMIYTESQIELVNPKTIYFEVSADQSEVTELYLGQEVNIVLDSFSDEEYPGTIEYISFTPKTGETGIAYRVKVKLSGDNFDIKKFRIGMTGDAKFILREVEEVLYLPPDFVNSDSKGKYVNKERLNNRVYVEVGLEGEERVEVSGDINEGDMVYD